MKRSPAEGFDLDSYEQERLYRAETGDKPWFVGFDRRFDEWCRLNPPQQARR